MSNLGRAGKQQVDGRLGVLEELEDLVVRGVTHILAIHLQQHVAIVNSGVVSPSSWNHIRHVGSVFARVGAAGKSHAKGAVDAHNCGAILEHLR